MFAISNELTDLKIKERSIYKILYSMNSHPVATPEMSVEEARCYILFFSEGPNLSAFIGLYLPRTDRKFFYTYSSNPFPMEGQGEVEDEARNFAEDMGFLLDEINVGGMAAEDRNHWIEEQYIFGFKKPEVVEEAATPAGESEEEAEPLAEEEEQEEPAAKAEPVPAEPTIEVIVPPAQAAAPAPVPPPVQAPVPPAPIIPQPVSPAPVQQPEPAPQQFQQPYPPQYQQPAPQPGQPYVQPPAAPNYPAQPAPQPYPQQYQQPAPQPGQPPAQPPHAPHYQQPVQAQYHPMPQPVQPPQPPYQPPYQPPGQAYVQQPQYQQPPVPELGEPIVPPAPQPRAAQRPAQPRPQPAAAPKPVVKKKAVPQKPVKKEEPYEELGSAGNEAEEAVVVRPNPLEAAHREQAVRHARPKAQKAHDPSGAVTRDKEALARLLASF